MTQIRICWQSRTGGDDDEAATTGGAWFADTEANRRDLESVAHAGNEVSGAGTHWIEERDVCLPSDHAAATEPAPLRELLDRKGDVARPAAQSLITLCATRPRRREF
jgi:hypothetical protein